MSEIFYDAFISYGRPDSLDFCRMLHQRLRDQGLKVWFDKNQQDLPVAVDYQKQIDGAIERAHTFLFFISPHSVNSTYCRKEIKLAVQYNKRIIPIFHLGEISYDTWKQRHSHKTEADWAACRAKGEHLGDNRNPNMHPAIAKINWLYFQDRKDNPEVAFRSLLEAIAYQQDYVRNHTLFLAKALDWERNGKRKQRDYLLVGEDRVNAEKWLKTNFKEQPPCEPTDLHCEYICESIENANNLMTQVFLCHADADQEIALRIGKTLMRKAITLWTREMDADWEKPLEDEIKHGIEATDNVLYFISLEAVRSPHCQLAIAHAQSLNKRIIPLIVQSVANEHISGFGEVIDCTQPNNEKVYQNSTDKLLQRIAHDAPYYTQHKVLLAKALKWDHQKRNNTSLLLRGHNLHRAQDWWKMEQGRSLHPLTQLHQDFIAESLAQPQDATQEVFLSYSRIDSDFARHLNDTLQNQGKTTWFDQESIVAAEDFQKEIYRGIENSANFLFILSPAAVKSPYCADEVDRAVQLNKRIITVLHQPIDIDDLPKGLKQIQWIDFNQHGGDFNTNFSELVRALDTDREHVQSHTKWSQRSREWEQHNRSDDLLLRGSELSLATGWLQIAEQKHKQPLPTQSQKVFISTSQAVHDSLLQKENIRRRRELRQARIIAVGSAIAGVAMTGLAAYAIRESQLARIREVNALIAFSEASLALNRTFDALNYSVEAAVRLRRILIPLPDDLRQQLDKTLRRAIHEVQELNRIQGHKEPIYSVSFNPSGEYIATASEDSTVRLWDLQGRQIRQFEGHRDVVLSVSFSPDGKYIVTASRDSTVRLWNVETGQEVRQLKGHVGTVMDVEFSHDGQAIATVGEDGTARLWSLQGQELRQFKGHTQLVASVSFSPDGIYLATASYDGTARLWDLQGGELRQLIGHEGQVVSISFNPTGEYLATASWDGTARLWDLQGHELRKIQGDGILSDVSFSPNQQHFATVSETGSVNMWDLQGNQLTQFHLRGHQTSVNSVDFSSRGQHLATASEDGTVRLWDLQGNHLSYLQAPANHQAVGISLTTPEGHLVTISTNGTSLWNLHGKQLTQLQGSDEVVSVGFSSDGRFLAIGLFDGTTHLWNLQNNRRLTLNGNGSLITHVNFSSDNQRLATASEDGTIRVWTVEGSQVAAHQGMNTTVLSMSFSPDGQRLGTVSDDGVARLWEFKEQQFSILEEHNGLTSISISSKGDVAVASDDGVIKLQDLAGHEVRQFNTHSNSIRSISFSTDGQYLATGNEDGTAWVWDLQGNRFAQFQGHTEPVIAVDFSPNGQYLSTVSEDGTARLWQVDDFETSVARGCNWIYFYLKYNNRVLQNSSHLCDSFVSPQ